MNKAEQAYLDAARAKIAANGTTPAQAERGRALAAAILAGDNRAVAALLDHGPDSTAQLEFDCGCSLCTADEPI